MKKTKPRKKPGPEPRYNDKQLADALVKNKGQTYLTAHNLGISYELLRLRINASPELQRIKKEVKNRTIDQVEGKLIEACMKGEAWGICFFLKTQGKHRGYIERSELRHGNDPKSPLPQRSFELDSLPLELRRQILAHIQAHQNGKAPEEVKS